MEDTRRFPADRLADRLYRFYDGMVQDGYADSFADALQQAAHEYCNGRKADAMLSLSYARGIHERSESARHALAIAGALPENDGVGRVRALLAADDADAALDFALDTLDDAD